MKRLVIHLDEEEHKMFKTMAVMNGMQFREYLMGILRDQSTFELINGFISSMEDGKFKKKDCFEMMAGVMEARNRRWSGEQEAA